MQSNVNPPTLEQPVVSTLVKVQDLNISCNKHTILKNVSLEIYTGQIITIIGPNGAGKSSLIRAILGFFPKFTGKITKHPDLKIGYVPQKMVFSEQIPISVNKFLCLNINPDDCYTGLSLTELSVSHLLDKSVHALSGGELQRVLLAKALMNKPNLLILDEPTKGIDINGQEEFYRLCSVLQKKLGCAILMASHDLHVVMSGVTSVICLNKHICCQGLPQNVSRHQEFIKLFGNNFNKLAIYRHTHDHQHSLNGDIQER